MLKKISFGLVAFGFATQVMAAPLTMGQIYNYAKKGDMQSLRKVAKHIDSVGKDGNTNLCRAVYNNDYKAFNALKTAGASVQHACVKKIPAEKIKAFNEGYANWARGMNASAKVATGTTTAGTVATTTGLSTGAMVGIGVGAVALIGGGIALAAGGGGGGGSSAPVCSGHGTKDTEGLCVCDTGYAGDNCETCAGGFINQGDVCYAELGCVNGTQNKDKCDCRNGWNGTLCETANACEGYETSCPVGYAQSATCQRGDTPVYQCNNCAAGYEKFGDSCFEKINCNHGTQSGDRTCDCNQGWGGDVCNTCDTAGGYISLDGGCYLDQHCDTSKHLHQEANRCVCDAGYPVEYQGECYALIVGGCGTNEMQQGNECVCKSGYDKIDGVCTLTACPAGTYLSGSNCVSCPANSTSPAGSVNESQCLCNDGYIKVNGQCVSNNKSKHVYLLGTDLNKTSYVHNSDINVPKYSTALLAKNGASITLKEGNKITLLSGVDDERYYDQKTYGMASDDANETNVSTVINNGTISAVLDGQDDLSTYFAMATYDSDNVTSHLFNTGIIEAVFGEGQAQFIGMSGGDSINFGDINLSTNGNISQAKSYLESRSVFGMKGTNLNNIGNITLTSNYDLNPTYINSLAMTAMHGTNLINDGTITVNHQKGGVYSSLVALEGENITNNGNVIYNVQDKSINGKDLIYGSDVKNKGTVLIDANLSDAQIIRAGDIENEKEITASGENSTLLFMINSTADSLNTNNVSEKVINSGTIFASGKNLNLTGMKATNGTNSGNIQFTTDTNFLGMSGNNRETTVIGVESVTFPSVSTYNYPILNSGNIDIQLELSGVNEKFNYAIANAYGVKSNRSVVNDEDGLINLKSYTNTEGDTDLRSYLYGIYGNAVTNNGNIQLETSGLKETYLYGIRYATGYKEEESPVVNNNEISLKDKNSGYSSLTGIYGVSETAKTTVTNNKKITLESTNSEGSGMLGIRGGHVINNGDIRITADNVNTATGDGIRSDTYENNGTITISGSNMVTVFGIDAESGINKGTIDLTGKTVYGIVGNQSETGILKITSTGNVLGIKKGSDEIVNNYGSVTINNNLSGSSVTGVYNYMLEGTSGTFNNYGTITLNLNRTNENATDLHNYHGGNEYIGIEMGSGNGTTNNYGKIELIETNTSDMDLDLGTIDGIAGNGIINNYGDIIIDKKTDKNEQSAHGIVLVGGETIINGYKDEETKMPALISVSSSGIGDVYGISKSCSGVSGCNGTFNLENYGDINVTKNDGGSGTIYGIYNQEYDMSNTLLNSGNITVKNNGSGNAFGLYADISISQENESSITNTGTIDVTSSGEKVYGVYLTATKSDDRDYAYTTFTNNGTINVEGTADNSEVYGIYAKGENARVYNAKDINVSASGANSRAYGIYATEGALVYNTGTVKINGSENSSAYYYAPKYNGTSIDPVTYERGYWYNPPLTSESGWYTSRDNKGTKEDPFTMGNFQASEINVAAFMLKDGATLIQDALVQSSVPLLMTGNIQAGKNFALSAPLVTGELGIADSVVMNENKSSYQIKNAFVDTDASKLNLISQSALFNASLAENGKDVIMTMKGFDTATDNESLSDFLTHNYAMGNNEGFFNKLKGFGDVGSLTAGLNSLTGQDMLSRFNFEDMTMMRELNFDMNDKLFHNKKQSFSLAGSVSPMAFKGDTGSNARYSLFNKRQGKFSLGLGVAFTDVRSDDDHNDNARSETMYQLVVPMGYKTHGFNLVTSPRLGYARGSYDRTGFEGKNYDGTIEKRVFGLMNEARYPMMYGDWSVEPSAEFNVIGYQQKGSEDAKEYSLNIKSQNTYSVEGGFGLYLNKVKELAKDKTLKLNLGASVYHEFADPYQLEVGLTGMDGSFMLRDEERSDNRAVVRAGFDYAEEDYSIYGSFISYIDREVRTALKSGFKWKF